MICTGSLGASYEVMNSESKMVFLFVWNMYVFVCTAHVLHNGRADKKIIKMNMNLLNHVPRNSFVRVDEQQQ